YHALRMGKARGLRVIVTGEANDELCCGHGGMIQIRDGYYRRWLPYMRKPTWGRRAIAAVVPALSPKHRDVLRRAAANQESFWSYETAWMDSDKPAILSKDVRTRTENAARIVDGCKRHFDGTDHRSRDYIFYIIYAMMQDFYF